MGGIPRIVSWLGVMAVLLAKTSIQFFSLDRVNVEGR